MRIRQLLFMVGVVLLVAACGSQPTVSVSSEVQTGEFLDGFEVEERPFGLQVYSVES